MSLRGTLIPQRRSRRPDDCQTMMSFHSADRLGPGGLIAPGESLEYRQVPGTWVRWLGRTWRFREWR